MLKRINIIAAFLTVLTMFIIPLASHAGLDDKSLVLYLSFDEGNGNTAKDGSQHGHDGELIAGPNGLMDNMMEKHLSLMEQKVSMLKCRSTIHYNYVNSFQWHFGLNEEIRR